MGLSEVGMLLKGDDVSRKTYSQASSVLIYVEFGSAFPFNGGELIYVS